MKEQFAHRLVGSHRWILISGTVIIAAATSLLVEDARNAGNWLVLVGGAFVMYAADLLGDIDTDSRELARASDRTQAKTRADLYEAHAPRFTGFAISLAVGLVVCGLVIR